jgi:hypothetical protein
MMTIVNLTPHDITILDEDKQIVLVVPRSMKVARLLSERKLSHTDNGLNFYVSKYGIPYLVKINENGEEIGTVQFPKPKEGAVYIVSAIFRSAVPRSDLWAPGELVRDEAGRPIGCIGLSQ